MATDADKVEYDQGRVSSVTINLENNAPKKSESFWHKLKRIFGSFILLGLIACSEYSTKQTDQNSSSGDTSAKLPRTTKKQVATLVAEDSDSITYSMFVDTLIIGAEYFIVGQSDPRSDHEEFLFILNSHGDTIYRHDGYATNGFKLEDFDNNGMLDIRLYQLTNVGGISELIMYDKTNSKFREVTNFENFPEPTKVATTNYWYSYHRSGCADSNWGSELFKIVHFEAIAIGALEGIGCEGEKENGIFVYQLIEGNKKRIHVEQRAPNYYADKRDYIAAYWTKNYRLFQ